MNIFLVFAQNINYEYRLELQPALTIYILSKNKKNIIFHLKIIIFTAVRNHSILHRHVCVLTAHIEGFVLLWLIGSCEKTCFLGFRPGTYVRILIRLLRK